MSDWLEEFLIVTGASWRLQIALFAIPVVPSLIVLLGVFLIGRPLAAGPYSVVIAATREGFFDLFLIVALAAGINCFRLAVREYRCTRNRLLG